MLAIINWLQLTLVHAKLRTFTKLPCAGCTRVFVFQIAIPFCATETSHVPRETSLCEHHVQHSLFILYMLPTFNDNTMCEYTEMSIELTVPAPTFAFIQCPYARGTCLHLASPKKITCFGCNPFLQIAFLELVPMSLQCYSWHFACPRIMAVHESIVGKAPLSILMLPPSLDHVFCKLSVPCNKMFNCTVPVPNRTQGPLVSPMRDSFCHQARLPPVSSQRA